MMLAIKFFGISVGVGAFRSYSSKSTTKGNFAKWGRSKFKYKAKKNDSESSYSPRSRITWTDEQKRILAAVKDDKASVFISGSAGTGKTVLVKHIIKLLKRMYGKGTVGVTASTGVAAFGLNGQTLHSFAGVMIPNVGRELLMERVLSDRKACKSWQKVKALVIDEISMVDADLFDNLEYIARQIRGVDKSWGGIQLIVSGDFFQLPPVRKDCLSNKLFAFEADCWDSSFDLQVELKRIFRQSDPHLIELLEGIRRGKCDSGLLSFLAKSCSSKEQDPTAVQIFPRNLDVQKTNAKRLAELPEEEFIYSAFDEGKDPWKSRLKQGMTPDELSLRRGARVMLIKNLNVWQGLVNGATGTVIRFEKTCDMKLMSVCKDGFLPVVRFDSGIVRVIEPDIWAMTVDDKVVATRYQIPLILAWAISVHKCQGMAINKVHTNLSRAFDYGMVYVALSRVVSLEGLHLSGFDSSLIKAHPKVLEFYKRLAVQV